MRMSPSPSRRKRGNISALAASRIRLASASISSFDMILESFQWLSGSCSDSESGAKDLSCDLVPKIFIRCGQKAAREFTHPVRRAIMTCRKASGFGMDQYTRKVIPRHQFEVADEIYLAGCGHPILIGRAII